MTSDILDTFQITEVIIFIDVQVPSLWLLSSPLKEPCFLLVIDYI